MNEEYPICWLSLSSPIRPLGKKKFLDCPSFGELVVLWIVSSELYHNPLKGLQNASPTRWVPQNHQRGKILSNKLEPCET